MRRHKAQQNPQTDMTSQRKASGHPPASSLFKAFQQQPLGPKLRKLTMQNTTQNSSWNSFICRASLQDPQREASWVVYVALHIDDRVLAGLRQGHTRAQENPQLKATA